jgi:hypothetical protein
LRSTGHASRGTGGPPSPSPSNLFIAPGTVSPEALIGTISNGLLVTELMGMGVNAVTGDYSRGAAGFWIDDGNIAFPVSEVTIAGNLTDMFLALDPASDLEFRGTINAPTSLVGEMTVAGVRRRDVVREDGRVPLAKIGRDAHRGVVRDAGGGHLVVGEADVGGIAAVQRHPASVGLGERDGPLHDVGALVAREHEGLVEDAMVRGFADREEALRGIRVRAKRRCVGRLGHRLRPVLSTLTLRKTHGGQPWLTAFDCPG